MMNTFVHSIEDREQGKQCFVPEVPDERHLTNRACWPNREIKIGDNGACLSARR